MSKYMLLLGIFYLGVGTAAEPQSPDKSTKESNQKKEHIKNIEEPVVLDTITIKAQKPMSTNRSAAI